MKRRVRHLLLGALLVTVVIPLGAGAVRGMLRSRGELKDVLPAFIDPPPGRRAPRVNAFGLTVGKSTLTEVQRVVAKAGLDCPDTSMRALMQKMRAEKKREIEERKARGQDVDGISGASTVDKRSPKEANPQVRLACSDVPSSVLSDRPRPASAGRLLLVFDSPKHPLRHVSFERIFGAGSESDAVADLQDAARALDLTLGPASSESPRDIDGLTALAWLSPAEAEWRYSDLNVRVSAINYGPRGTVVSEIVEIPWPVRADARMPE